jgi:hypothetical protein
MKKTVTTLSQDWTLDAKTWDVGEMLIESDENSALLKRLSRNPEVVHRYGVTCFS